MRPEHRVPRTTFIYRQYRNYGNPQYSWSNKSQSRLVMGQIYLNVSLIYTTILCVGWNYFIHSISMCRMLRFLAVLRSIFHPSLLCIFSYHISPPTILPSFSPHLAIYFLVYLSVLLFQNSYKIPFWEFYFLPFSVHAQTNVIYLTLLSLL